MDGCVVWPGMCMCAPGPRMKWAGSSDWRGGGRVVSLFFVWTYDFTMHVIKLWCFYLRCESVCGVIALSMWLYGVAA